MRRKETLQEAVLIVTLPCSATTTLLCALRPRTQVQTVCITACLNQGERGSMCDR
jgi:hypothetical protein